MITKGKIEEVIECIFNCDMSRGEAHDYAQQVLLENPHAQFNRQYNVGTAEPTHDNVRNAAQLILDEVIELYEELFEGVHVNLELGMAKKQIDVAAVAKEMTDIRYITGERATMFRFDVPALDREVHRSNMSKRVSRHNVVDELRTALERYPHATDETFDCESFVIRCGLTGKVIKPTTYSPANITSEMLNYDDSGRN